MKLKNFIMLMHIKKKSEDPLTISSKSRDDNVIFSAKSREDLFW